LLDIHLFSEVHQGGDIASLYVFGSVALLILFIALINYTNLATARSFYRAKEVGLRKTLGAFRYNVIMQLLGESFITSLVAMIIALILIYLLLPVFNTLSGASIHIGYLNEPILIIGIVILYILIAVMAGIYPALKMAKFSPAVILKGQFKGTGQGSYLRKSLIVLQFVISISLIVATVIIYNQLDYINNKELGYSKENIVVVPVSKRVIEKSDEFKVLLTQNPQIIDVTISSETPTNIQGGYSIYQNGGRSLGVVAAAVDENYLSALDILLVAGRAIDRADILRCRESEEYSFMVNESAVTLLEWTPSEAVGQTIELNGRKGKIVGVVKDFHFRAFYEPVQQLVLFTEQSWAYNYALIKVGNTNLTETLAAMEFAWKSFDEATPFSYNFLDSEFAHLHLNATRAANLLTTFAGLAILIASLGLFGIVSFSMVQRSKEIGIRKVLGASVNSILLMTNKEFLILIMLSMVISFPLTYYVMSKWLNGFVYHTSVGMLPLLLGAVFSVIVAVVTISFETLKAALVNPVETLRNE
jgi:putative ABC transport system permease protein